VKRSAKLAALRCLSAIGLFALARVLTRHEARILCYHGFSYRDEPEFAPQLFMQPATFRQRLDQIAAHGFQVVSLQELVRRVPVSDQVVKYALEFARRTRVTTPEAPDFVKQWLAWGAGPRASQFLVLGGKAHAALKGRNFVTDADIRAVVKPVLRHRLVTTFSAQAEGVTTDAVIDRLIDSIPRAQSEVAADGRLPQIFGS